MFKNFSLFAVLAALINAILGVKPLKSIQQRVSPHLSAPSDEANASKVTVQANGRPPRQQSAESKAYFLQRAEEKRRRKAAKQAGLKRLEAL